MTTEAYKDPLPTEAYDTSSDPNFVAYYAAESQTPETQERFTRVRDRALELLAANGHLGPHDVIDIGCGAGTQAMLWAELGHRVRALDVNRQLVAIGRDRAATARLDVDFDVGTATALPYPDHSADVVLMPELLEHVAEWEQCMKEAVRVLRPGGLLYLSTTNWLCPVQQEFELPAYSWYPGFVKRWCERKAVTTHGHWVSHARYPAVNWFSYYSLSAWLGQRGFRTLDRFDMLATQPLSGAKRAVINTVRAVPPLRLLAHVMSEGTTVWALRSGGASTLERRALDAVETVRTRVQRAPEETHAANRTLRILYHHRTSAQDGSAVHIDGLVNALREQGHEVVMVAPRVAVATSAQRVGAVSRLRKRLPRAVHELLELAYNLPEAVRLARAVRLHRPDVIYERSNLFTISGAVLSKRLGVPRITEVNAPYFLERSQHGGLAWPRLAKWSEDLAWRRADAVVAVTHALGRIVEQSSVPRDHVHVMSNGIDASLMRTEGSLRGARERLGWSDRLILGFTGYVREWNRLESVVDLLAEPGNERLALLVVGDGTSRTAVESRAADRRVAERVRFTGLVARDQVPYWVSAFDIALQPAANPYASPLKLFEYMALGRAIVAPDQPNIREVVQHERDALLFDPSEPRAFADAIARLADDPDLRRRLAANARSTLVQRDLTWSNNARRVSELVGRLQAQSTERTVPASSDALGSR